MHWDRPSLGTGLLFFIPDICINFEFCSCGLPQACLVVEIRWKSEIITSMNRKRWNRAVKRKIVSGVLSEEEAKSKCIHWGYSTASLDQTKKSEEAIMSEDEVKQAAESKNSHKAWWAVNEWQFKGSGKGGSLGVTLGSSNVVAADVKDAQWQKADGTASKKVIPPALQARGCWCFVWRHVLSLTILTHKGSMRMISICCEVESAFHNHNSGIFTALNY